MKRILFALVVWPLLALAEVPLIEFVNDGAIRWECVEVIDGEDILISAHVQQEKALACVVTRQVTFPDREFRAVSKQRIRAVINSEAAAQFVSEKPLAVTSISGGTLGQFIDADVGVGRVGSELFDDRSERWQQGSIPDSFLGCLSIQTNYADRALTTSSVVSFTLSEEAQVTVWVSDNLTGGVPGWVASDGYVDNGRNVIHTDFGGFASGFSALKSGTVTLDAPTTDADDTAPMYVVSICQSWRRGQAVVEPGPTDNGEYEYVGAWQRAESSTGPTADVRRINGTDGAVSVDITDLETGTCTSGVDYTAVPDTTINWADNVGGVGGGITLTTSAVGADCTIIFGFTNAVGGIAAAAQSQTQTTTVLDTVSPGSIFVDCDDTGSLDTGTQTEPYKTLQQAFDVVDPGDVVDIMNGTCGGGNGPINEIARLSRSGTAGNPITFRSFSGHTPQIGTIPATLDEAYGILLFGADYITFSDLTFKGTRFSCLSIDNNGTNGSTNITVTGSTFDQCGRAETSCTNFIGHVAIYVESYSEEILIEKNMFTNTGRVVNPTACDPLGNADNHQYRHDHAIYAKGRHVTIQNNFILDYPAGYGVKIDGYRQILGQVVAPDYSHVIINNTFGPNTSVQPYDKRSGMAMTTYNSTATSYDPRWLIKNNLVLDPARSSDRPFAIQIRDSGSQNFPTDNNCEYNVSTEDDITMLSTCGDNVGGIAANVTELNNVENETIANMNLVDTGSNNYRIGAGSNAIDAADCSDALAPTDDFDGNARGGGTCDAGAYEYTP